MKSGSYQTTLSVPGVTATVSPSILHFAQAGDTKTVTITFSPRGGSAVRDSFRLTEIRRGWNLGPTTCRGRAAGARSRKVWWPARTQADR